MTDKLYYTATTRFESACELPLLASEHRSHGLHGHSFLARVRAEPPLDWSNFKGSETDQLNQALADSVAPLNYHSLNNYLDNPTDENLSRWVHKHINVPNVRMVGVQSTLDEVLI